MTALTDRDLIVCARGGAAGGDAFGELVMRYQTSVFNVGVGATILGFFQRRESPSQV